MIGIHELLFQMIALYTLICAGWGLINYRRHRPVTDSYRTTLLIAELMFVAQALVGLELLGEGRAPADPLHYLYGLVGIAILPSVTGYAAGRGKKREGLWLGLACLVLFGVSIRAFMTGT